MTFYLYHMYICIQVRLERTSKLRDFQHMLAANVYLNIVYWLAQPYRWNL